MLSCFIVISSPSAVFNGCIRFGKIWFEPFLLCVLLPHPTGCPNQRSKPREGLPKIRTEAFLDFLSTTVIIISFQHSSWQGGGGLSSVPEEVHCKERARKQDQDRREE
eukprot:3092494-Amphidinium_carterae.1